MEKIDKIVPTKEELAADMKIQQFVGKLFDMLEEEGLMLTAHPFNDKMLLITHGATGIQKEFCFKSSHDMIFSDISKIRQ